MYKNINKGDAVIWSIGGRQVQGQVVDIYEHTVSGRIKSYLEQSQLNADTYSALLIELEDGRKVLKLQDEVRRQQ